MTRELLSAVRRIASSVDLCAMDMVEVSPPYDLAEITALAAHRVVLETSDRHRPPPLRRLPEAAALALRRELVKG